VETDLPTELSKAFREIERLRAQWKDAQDRLQAMLSWMADQDPQLVDAAISKFNKSE
jgi:hypothetical protein